MATLSEVRGELADQLAAAFPDLVVHRAAPGEMHPPCLVVQQADPLLIPTTTEDTYEPQWEVALWVFAFVDISASNTVAADRIDDLVVAVPETAIAHGWGLTDVTGPGPYSSSQWLAHGVRFTFTQAVDLT